MSRFISYLNSCNCRLPSKEKLKETEEETKKEFSQEYLTFEALGDGTFTFTNPINYSIDNGTTWVELAAKTATPTITSGSKIMWKATLTPGNNSGIGKFSSTGNFNVEGNAMSLLYGDNFVGQTDLTGKDHIFNGLFSNCSKLISAENLSLPATTLASYCYLWMFSGCTSLTTAPEELPATTLVSNCYSSMFNGCTSLTTAPELPATTLALNCYSFMFQDCISLTSAPELPATTLEETCYGYMFSGCTSLNYIKAMFTTTPSTSYTPRWVYGVASTGTFVKNSAATWNVSGVHGVPTGWTIETA